MAAFIEQYDLMFKSLKTGIHDFNYILDNRFFGFFETPDYNEGKMCVDLQVVKKPNFLSLSFRFMGQLRVVCDRCLEEFDLPMDFDTILYIKAGEEKPVDDGDVIYLDPDDHKINLAGYFFETIRLNFPIKRIHNKNEKGEDMCDRDMIRKLHQHKIGDMKTKTDPRWDKLKEIMSKIK